jgi:hypothetical protein
LRARDRSSLYGNAPAPLGPPRRAFERTLEHIRGESCHAAPAPMLLVAPAGQKVQDFMALPPAEAAA